MIEYYNIIASCIVKIVCALIGLGFSAVIIPWIRKQLIPWLKDKRLYALVSTFVHAAEKMADAGAIDKETKKKWVIRMLMNRGIAITDEVEAFIESAVEELDLAWSEGLVEIEEEFYEEDDEEDDEDDVPTVSDTDK